MRVNRFLILLSIFLLLALALVNAKTASVTESFQNGLVIKQPFIETHKINTNYILDLHVYNSTGSPTLNKTIGCYAHLYNETGTHIAKVYQRVVSDDFDFEFTFNSNNFSKLGEYSIISYCNDSSIGGYSEQYFRVNNNGQADNSYTAINNLAVVIALLLLSFIFLYFAFNLTEDHFILRLLLLFFALIPTLLIARPLSHGFDESILKLLSIPTWFFRIFVCYFSVYLFYHWIKKSDILTKWFGKG